MTRLPQTSRLATVGFTPWTEGTDAEYTVAIGGVQKFGVQVCPYMTDRYRVNAYGYRCDGSLWSMTELGGFDTLGAADTFLANHISNL
jgi:hypothetical protein